jgi:hypothetical protein
MLFVNTLWVLLEKILDLPELAPELVPQDEHVVGSGDEMLENEGCKLYHWD